MRAAHAFHSASPERGGQIQTREQRERIFAIIANPLPYVLSFQRKLESPQITCQQFPTPVIPTPLEGANLMEV